MGETSRSNPDRALPRRLPTIETEPLPPRSKRAASAKKPARRVTLSEQVAEQLKRQILSGDYAPGDRLKPELQIASELGVNRFTVREAMNQLEQLRLIERRAGAGTLVLDYTQTASVDVIEYLVLSQSGEVNLPVLENLLETAGLLSADIAKLAAKRRTEADLLTLSDLVYNIRKETCLSKLLWLDFEFNWALACASQNLVPRLLLNSVRGLLEKYAHLLETLWVTGGSAGQGYSHVVEAIEAGDAERAGELASWIWMHRKQRFTQAIQDLNP